MDCANRLRRGTRKAEKDAWFCLCTNSEERSGKMMIKTAKTKKRVHGWKSQAGADGARKNEARQSPLV